MSVTIPVGNAGSGPIIVTLNQGSDAVVRSLMGARFVRPPTSKDLDNAIKLNDGWMLDRWFPYLDQPKIWNAILMGLKPDTIRRYNFDDRIADLLFEVDTQDSKDLSTEVLWSIIREKVQHEGYVGLVRLAFQKGATITDQSLGLCCHHDTVEILEEVLRFRKITKDLAERLIDDHLVDPPGRHPKGVLNPNVYHQDDRATKIALLRDYAT